MAPIFTIPESEHQPNHKRSTNRTKLLVIAAVGLVGGLVLGWFTIRLLSGDPLFGPPSFHGSVIQSQEPLRDFTLTASNDEKIHLQDFRDKVVLVYFGYTYCPDVCPATLAVLSNVMEKLDPEEKEQVQVLMVSVDPDRDTPAALADYLAHFDPSFLGLTGTPDEIAAAAAPFGIYYQKGEGSVESGYLIDHTATVAALDKEGLLRLTYHFNTPGKDIAADVRRLVNE